MYAEGVGSHDFLCVDIVSCKRIRKGPDAEKKLIAVGKAFRPLPFWKNQKLLLEDGTEIKAADCISAPSIRLLQF